MPKQMSLVASLQALKLDRGDEVILTAMGTAREWMALGDLHPLDFVYVPSSMGQATALGLGLALAQPSRKVVVCNGDGSMLMNLGSLVTITAQAPENFTLLLFDNGVYEVTGLQLTPGSVAARKAGDDVDFCSMARACGFSSVYEFEDLERWQTQARSVIDAPGPTFARLKVAPIPDRSELRSPSPATERATAFQAALSAQ